MVNHCHNCQGLTYGVITGTAEEKARWTKIALLRQLIDKLKRKDEDDE